MKDLKKQERTAIETVARWLSATWEKGGDPPDAYVTLAGKRVAVDIKTLSPRGTGQGNAAKPRLRFDKVATRLLERLRATLGETVPHGMTVLLTRPPPRWKTKYKLFSREERLVEMRKIRFTGIASTFDF